MKMNVIQLFGNLPVFITDGHKNRQCLPRRTLEGPLYRAAVTKISAYGQLYVFIGDPRIIGGINPRPPVTGYPGLHPGMGSALSPHTIFVRAYIPAYVTGRYATGPEYLQHQVCKILADPGPLPKDLVYRRRNIGNPFDVFEILEDILAAMLHYRRDAPAARQELSRNNANGGFRMDGFRGR
jgi:hypothetical protein